MEPASLTLGIVPLIAGAIKSYGSLKDKLDIFHHHSRQLLRMQKRLDLERRRFLNETRILTLTAIEDQLLVTEMIDDPDNPEWHSKTTETAFRRVLLDSYNGYLDAINSICRTIQEIQTEMECFNWFGTQQRENEKLKETIYRIRDKFKLTWNKASLEKSLNELDESNGKLQCLGEQMRKIEEFKPESTIVNGLNKQNLQECARFRMVGRASKAFYRTYANAWSSQSDTCQYFAIRQHHVRLFLDTKALESVSMDLIMECPGHMSSIRVPLQIKSENMQWTNTGLQSPPDPTSATAEVSQPKRRRVHFQDEKTIRVSTVPPVEPFQQKVTRDMDIPNLMGRNLCHFLQQTCFRRSQNKCVGYLDSFYDEAFRHSIYPRPSSICNLAAVLSIGEVLDSFDRDEIDIIDQLNIARALVAAVLKFHSTPWLARLLTLRDILLFKNSQGLDKHLSTLHFDTSFEDNQNGKDASMTDASEQEYRTNAMETAIENAGLDHGIRNMTLWCLGVILLQIGHWLRLAKPEDVREVRNLAKRRTDISIKYDELTRRCLNCDFGYGEDLTRPRLQQAVYEKVYCELVSMIDSMTISED